MTSSAQTHLSLQHSGKGEGRGQPADFRGHSWGLVVGRVYLTLLAKYAPTLTSLALVIILKTRLNGNPQALPAHTSGSRWDWFSSAVLTGAPPC